MAAPGSDPSVDMIALVIEFASKATSSIGGHHNVYNLFGRELSGTRPKFVMDPPDPNRRGFYVPEIFVDQREKANIGEHRGRVYYLDQISEMIRSGAPHVPGGSSISSARDDIIQNFTSSWANIAERCLIEVDRATRERVNTLLSECFGRSGVRLRDIITSAVNSRLQRQFDAARRELRDTAKVELLGFTRNEDIMTLYKNRVKNQYIAAFMEGRRARPSVADESAIDFMAQVRAYFEAAYTRFRDNVVLTIKTEYVLPNQDHGLKDVLLFELHLGTDFFQQILADWIRSVPPGGSSLTWTRMH